MAGQGEGEVVDGVGKLGNYIAGIKYTLFFVNIITWILGASMFGVALWLRLEPGFQEWVDKLYLHKYYAGIYVLIVASLLVMAISFVGCASALIESTTALLGYIGAQVVSFILGVAGSAVLLTYSTSNSKIQPIIRDIMTRLIVNSHHVPSANTLQMVQENIGCCGADGPNDYLTLKQPLPTQCRDTVTGNAFVYGCVDGLTWYMEGKTLWLSGIVMFACFLHVMSTVLTIVLIQALNKENEETSYSGKRYN